MENTNTNTNTNININSKKIGTREEVYKCLALKTAGGLCKSDIIEKQYNGKLIYVSKKISDKMKELIKKHNPTMFKKQKKTLSGPKLNKIINKINTKTQKISFETKNNEVKNIYYPELKGIDLKELKEELLREEEEEDLATIEGLDTEEKCKNKKSLEPFKLENIEELEDIDINNL